MNYYLQITAVLFQRIKTYIYWSWTGQQGLWSTVVLLITRYSLILYTTHNSALCVLALSPYSHTFCMSVINPDSCPSFPWQITHRCRTAWKTFWNKTDLMFSSYLAFALANKNTWCLFQFFLLIAKTQPVPVKVNISEWFTVVNGKHTQESFPSSHVLISHSTVFFLSCSVQNI